jgi:hypothetical protein
MWFQFSFRVSFCLLPRAGSFFTRHTVTGGGHVDSAFQHPMCHAKIFSIVCRLFGGIRIEVFRSRIFGAVENCAASKTINTWRSKKIPHVTEKSHTTTIRKNLFQLTEKLLIELGVFSYPRKP